MSSERDQTSTQVPASPRDPALPLARILVHACMIFRFVGMNRQPLFVLPSNYIRDENLLRTLGLIDRLSENTCSAI